MRRQVTACLLFAALGAACTSAPQKDWTPLSEAHLSPQWFALEPATEVRRVGVLTPTGLDLPEHARLRLQASVFSAMCAETGFEVLPLPEPQGEGQESSHEQLLRDLRLDALLVPQVTDYEARPPQRLGLRLQLIVDPTQAPLWDAVVHMDATDPRVREALRAFAPLHGQAGWHTYLHSPARFADFAAADLLRTLESGPRGRRIVHR